jgi:hypothetical protein
MSTRRSSIRSPRASRTLHHHIITVIIKNRRNATQHLCTRTKKDEAKATHLYVCTDRESNPGLYRGRVLFYH